MKFRPLFNPTQMQFQLTIGDWEATKGIQKISGFSRGLKFHKVDYFPYWHISNSIVLGYNRASKQHPVKLWMYGYAKGEHYQKELRSYEVGEKISPELKMNKYGHLLCIDDLNSYVLIDNYQTLPIGFQLFPFAEIDGTNKKKPFDVEITNIKIR